MPLHDAYARVTPYEIAVPDPTRLHALGAAVDEEASRSAVDPAELDSFLSLAAVGDFLAELHGDEVPRVALLEHGTFVFHALNFLRAGTPVFLLTTPAARHLVHVAVDAAVDVASQAAPKPPVHAGYLQLPQHLFWVSVEGSAPESVDGAFWTVGAGERLHVLPVTGMRPDRPGFGTLAVPDAPLAHAGEWLHASVREGGGDYQSDLPGAQLDRLYAIRSVGEILKLMARFFAHLAESPGEPGRPPAAVATGGPRPSSLPFTRLGTRGSADGP
jgi:hypothetical protein